MRLRGYKVPGYEGGINLIPSRVSAMEKTGMKGLCEGSSTYEGRELIVGETRGREAATSRKRELR